ncbi:PREDICTED: probable sodium/metabolite cotransporter BASS3, chloroplastic [Theobroma cacao]|uniref:Probable sodium/metabolite cotransporter BASS3, chloroplastic n=1 Tax=Theobroma cacao TaxID=3641 RepID=A0AB32VRL9_THECC|nr:PREDICTED: probable sodium/metabolite cotransporter BASS3, chloroplastic [Theobroma cacao]
MTSITPFPSLAAPTITAFTSKRKQVSICSKPATSFPCCYSNSGLKKLRGMTGYFTVTKNKGGGLFVFACSTTPYVRSVGSQRLSFGNNTDGGATQVATKGDVSQVLSAMLPFVVAVTAVAALVQPATFTWVSKELYAPALGGIMLSIGIRLSFDDFALAVKRPLPLSVGFFAQYMLKPALGVLIAKAFGMSPLFYSGFVLTSCVAGAQLSSYASFLSKGDVAVSILLTSFTTIASVLVTPLLTGLLIGSVVPVDAVAMSKSILQVVFVPVTVGLVLNTYAKPVVTILRPVMPFVAMICTAMCIGSPLALNRSQILSKEGIQLVLPVLAFHTAAFIVGYWISKIPAFRQREEVCRTVSLCTGMQSSTLAGLLATQFLGGSQAVPPACSVVAMAIMGLSLASFWGNGFRIRDLPSLRVPQTGSAVQT